VFVPLVVRSAVSSISQQRLRAATRTAALIAVSTSLLAVCAPAARADEDAQRETLARIAYELSRLEQLAADGARQQEAGSRTRFRFDWLARDLSLVRRGIEDHADAPRQPRAVPPLRGDYRP
jgi:RAQPRD family integrative conjugative element protein